MSIKKYIMVSAIFLAVLVSGAYLALTPSVLRGIVLSSLAPLERRYGVKITIGGVKKTPNFGQFEISNLVILPKHGLGVAHARRVSIQFSIFSLLFSGRPLSSIYISDPDLTIDFAALSKRVALGSRTSGPAISAGSLFAKRVMIRGGRVRVYDEKNSILELNETDVDIELGSKNTEVTWAIGPGAIFWKDTHVSIDASVGDVILHPNGRENGAELQISQLSVDGRDLDFLAFGNVRFDEQFSQVSQIDLKLELASNLAIIQKKFNLPVDLAGETMVFGRLFSTNLPDDFVFDGYLHSSQMQFDQVSFEKARAHFVASESGITFDDVLFRVGGSDANVFLDLSFDDNLSFQALLENNDLSLHELLWELGVENAWVDLSVDAKIFGRGQILPKFDFVGAGGIIAERLLVKDGPISKERNKTLLKSKEPITIKSKFYVDEDSFNFVDATLSDSSSTIETNCSLFFSKNEGLAIEISSEVINFDSIANRVLDIEFHGKGQVSGRVFGPYDKIAMDLHAKFDELLLEDFKLGSAQTNILLDESLLSFKNSSAKFGRSSYAGNVAIDFDEDALLRVDANSKQFFASALATMLPENCEFTGLCELKHLELVGPFSWHAKILGPLKKASSKPWTGEVKVDFKQGGELKQIPFASGKFRLKILPQEIELTKFHFEPMGGLVNGHLNVKKRDLSLDGQIEAKLLDLSLLPKRLLFDDALSGTLSFKTKFSGPLSGMNAKGQLVAKEIKHGNVNLGSFELLQVAKDGVMKITGELIGGKIKANLVLKLDESLPFRLAADVALLSWSDLFVYSDLPEELKTWASAHLDLHGRLSLLDEIGGEVTLSSFGGSIGELEFGLVHPAALELRGLGIEIEKLALASNTDDHVFLSGWIGSENIDGKLEVQTGLQPMAAAFSEIDSLSGKLSADISFRGTLTDPSFSGHVKAKVDRLALTSIEPTILNIRLRAFFDGHDIKIPTFTGKVGPNGRLESRGEITLDGFIPNKGELKFVVNDVGLRVPSLVSFGLNGEFKLVGSENRFALLGEGEIDRAVLRADIDWEQLLPKFGTSVQISDEILVGRPGLSYDIALRLKEPLRIEGRKVTALMNGGITLKGSTSSPSLSGTMSLVSGQAHFRGQAYTLQRARLDFVEEKGLLPNLDLEAETKIKNYDIQVRLHGALKSPVIRLTSQPHLSDIDVLSLMTLGFTKEELRSVGGTATSAGLEALGIFAGLEEKLRALLPKEMRDSKVVNIDELRLTSIFSDSHGVTLPAFLMGVDVLDGIKMRLKSSLVDAGSGALEQLLEVEQRFGPNMGWRLGWKSEGESNLGDAGADIWYRWNF